MTDIVVLNDSKKMNLLKRVVGDDRDHLLDVCDKTIFFCQLEKAFVSYDKIVLVCPPYAELESSFPSWCERILRLAKELNITIDIYGTHELHDSFVTMLKRVKIFAEMNFIQLDDTEDFFFVNNKSVEEDLIIFVSARSGSVSYYTGVDSFLTKLEKAMPFNDQILIYPSQEIEDNLYSGYDDFTTTPISKGVETIQKIGKEVGNIFKKGE